MPITRCFLALHSCVCALHSTRILPNPMCSRAALSRPQRALHRAPPPPKLADTYQMLHSSQWCIRSPPCPPAVSITNAACKNFTTTCKESYPWLPPAGRRGSLLNVAIPQWSGRCARNLIASPTTVWTAGPGPPSAARCARARVPQALSTRTCFKQRPMDLGASRLAPDQAPPFARPLPARGAVATVSGCARRLLRQGLQMVCEAEPVRLPVTMGAWIAGHPSEQQRCPTRGQRRPHPQCTCMVCIPAALSMRHVCSKGSPGWPAGGDSLHALLGHTLFKSHVTATTALHLVGPPLGACGRCCHMPAGGPLTLPPVIKRANMMELPRGRSYLPGSTQRAADHLPEAGRCLVLRGRCITASWKGKEAAAAAADPGCDETGPEGNAVHAALFGGVIFEQTVFILL
jgi:hypothetical protein